MAEHKGQTDEMHGVKLPSSIQRVQWADLRAAPGGHGGSGDWDPLRGKRVDAPDPPHQSPEHDAGHLRKSGLIGSMLLHCRKSLPFSEGGMHHPPSLNGNES
jgi:hypothetical protein